MTSLVVSTKGIASIHTAKANADAFLWQLGARPDYNGLNAIHWYRATHIRKGDISIKPYLKQ